MIRLKYHKPITWREDENGCWICTSHIDKTNRYSYISLNGKNILLHRFMYEHFKGIIPKNTEVCHSCDNTKCINPEHLFLGTHKENMQDCIQKKRFKMEMDNSGSNNGMSKLTEQQIFEIRHDRRTQKVIAEKYGVTQSAISNIKNRKRWK